MSELFFVLKVFVLTFVLVLFLQIKIGEDTLDNKIHRSLQESSVLAPLQEVAKGGVIALEQGYRNVAKMFTQKLSRKISQSDAPGNRSIMPELKRFKKESQEKIEKGVEQASQKFKDRLFNEEGN